MRSIIAKVEGRYHVKLPRTVLAVDYGDRGDLYLRFKHVKKPLGEPSEDGLIVFFYEGSRSPIVAVEILDLPHLMQ
ncbi:MAG TPA: hypothetical protein VEH01_04580 [Nitrososphaerales archaeon]|nr:hypothetical protein [Nitrososphaerales archaeon]